MILHVLIVYVAFIYYGFYYSNQWRSVGGTTRADALGAKFSGSENSTHTPSTKKKKKKKKLIIIIIINKYNTCAGPGEVRSSILDW